IAVVGPAVERGEALRAGAATATTVDRAVGTGCVPRHADEKRSVVTPVRRPPVLRVGHEGIDVAAQLVHVELCERLRVAVVLAERARAGVLLVQDVEIERVRPPVLVALQAGRGAGGPFATPRLLIGHGLSSRVLFAEPSVTRLD